MLAAAAPLHDFPHFTIDHGYATHEALVNAIRPAPEVEWNEPFFKFSHAPTFRTYFELLRAQGIEAYSTLEDSVVSESGARFRSLGSLLAAGKGD